MLVLNRGEHKILHKHFYDIVDLIDDNCILILNNTKVIPARLYGYKDTGAKIEVFLLKEKGKSTRKLLTRYFFMLLFLLYTENLICSKIKILYNSKIIEGEFICKECLVIYVKQLMIII